MGYEYEGAIVFFVILIASLIGLTITIGIVGLLLLLFFRAPELFGKNAPKHADLQIKFSRRKRMAKKV